MAQDKPEIYVYKVTSNTDALSAKVTHSALVSFMRRELEGGEIVLKGLVPKRDGDLAAHAGHKGPIDGDVLIEGSVGIPEIHKTDESSTFSAKYPLFVDQGTGVFGEHGTIFPKKEGGFMHIPPERGGGTEYPLFLRESKGQRPHFFMAETYASMLAMLQINGEIYRAELIEKMGAAKELT